MSGEHTFLGRWNEARRAARMAAARDGAARSLVDREERRRQRETRRDILVVGTGSLFALAGGLSRRCRHALSGERPAGPAARVRERGAATISTPFEPQTGIDPLGTSCYDPWGNVEAVKVGDSWVRVAPW